MAYSKELLSEALRQIERNRGIHEAEAADHRYHLSSSIPRLNEIDQELRQTSAKAMRIAFESNNTDAAINKLRYRNLSLQEEKKQLLLQHGFPEDYLSVKYDCPNCHDTGYHDGILCPCVKKKASELQKKQLSILLPPDNTFEKFRLDYYSAQVLNAFGTSEREIARVNLQKCRDFAEYFGKSYENLLLYGSPGLGKTFLSSCIARRVTTRGFSVTYDTAVSVFSQFDYVKYNTEDSTLNSQRLEKFRNVDLLIIDDLGSEMQSPYYTSCLYDILSYRLMRHLPIIFNTNLLPAELETRYSPAIASRILGEFTQLRFIGSDIRKIRKKQRL